MWLDPKPGEEDLHSIYSEHYYENPRFFDDGNATLYGYADYAGQRAMRCHTFGRLLKRVIRLANDGNGVAGKRLLDCGCGLGYLLEVAHGRGFSVEGIELNVAAANRIRKDMGFPVHSGDIRTFNGGPFDVVAMLDVIEHLHAPFETLSKVASFTRQGGMVIISTMDSDSIVSRLVGKRLEDFRRVSEHLYFFNRRTMSEALRRTGFDVVAIDSYGVTLPLGMLGRRVSLASPRIGGMLERMIAWMRLSSARIHFNPRTKMVVYARKVA